MITVVGNLKGGTGKSTVAFNLAAWLVRRNRTVALFDFDPQKTFHDVLEVRCEEGHLPKLPIAGEFSSFSSGVADRVDETIIDVSVGDEEALLAAVRVADRIVIPCAPSQADIWSTQKFLTKIKAISGLKPALAFINRADTHHMVLETEEAERALDALSGLQRLPIRLYQRTAYRRSFSEGLAVFELNIRDKAAQEVLALAALLYPRYT